LKSAGEAILLASVKSAEAAVLAQAAADQEELRQKRLSATEASLLLRRQQRTKLRCFEALLPIRER
jgi:hypothetical protein